MASAIKYYWQFGDGFTSIEKDPKHVYKMPGVYTVKLTVTFDNGSELSETKVNYITVTDVENSETNLVTETNKSFRYGIRKDQGIGFSENTGSAWPFPEVRSAGLQIVDDYNQVRQLVYDVATGQFFDIATRDGSATTGDVKYFKDGVTRSGSGGTDIQPSVRFKEDRGELEHYYITSTDNHIYLRPEDEDNQGATGYTAAGFPTGMEVDVSVFADGEQTTEKAKAEDITYPKNAVSFDKEVTAHRLQTLVELNKSDVRLTGRTQYYKAADVPDGGDTRLMNENTNQVNLSNVAQWLTRGSDLLLDRVSGTTLSGTVTSTTGPDRQPESAMVIADGADISLGNAAITSGQVQMWAKSSGTFVADFNNNNNITLGSVGTQGDWTLLKYEGSISSGMSLPSGSVFDYRLYTGLLSTTEESYYLTDIQRHSGETSLPWF